MALRRGPLNMKMTLLYVRWQTGSGSSYKDSLIATSLLGDARAYHIDW